MADMADKNQSSWLGGALIGALFIGACVLVVFMQQKTRGQGPGEFAGMLSVGGRLLVIDHPIRRNGRSGGGRGRLNLIDVASGQRLARARLESHRSRCVQANAARIWCKNGNKVDLIDVATLEVVADKLSIAQLPSPLLAQGLYANSGAELDKASGRIRLKLNDATWIAVTPELQVSSLPAGESERTWDGFEPAPPTAPPSPLSLTSDERAELRRGSERVGTETFLRGKVVNVDAPAQLGTELLITYVSSLAPDAEHWLARIASDGKMLWTAKLNGREVAAASVLDGRLIVFTATEAIALNLQDGQRIWTYKY